MPWKEASVMDERMKFVAKLLETMKFFNNNKKFAYISHYRRIPYLTTDFQAVVTTKL